MDGQTPLPEVDGLAPPPVPEMCAWCPEPATTEVEVEPPIMTTDKRTRVKVEKKPAVMARACASCARRLERRKAEAEHRKQLERRGLA